MGPLASPAGRLRAEIRSEVPIPPARLGSAFSLSRYIRATHFYAREPRERPALALILAHSVVFSLFSLGADVTKAVPTTSGCDG